MLTATAWKGYKSLKRQYFRTIAEPGAEVNREEFPVGRRKRLPHNFRLCIFITSLTPADVRGAAHSSRTGRHACAFRFSIGMGRESGKRGGEMGLPATRTGNRIAIMAD